MLVLINDILDLSKIEAGRLEVEFAQVDLRDCVETSLEVVAQKAIAKGLDICAYIAPDVPVLGWTDAVRLKQIVRQTARTLRIENDALCFRRSHLVCKSLRPLSP
jgi:signal transduction histidine kinase